MWRLSAAALALAVSCSAWAEFRVPPLTGPVVDEAGLFSAPTRAELDSLLRGLRRGGGAQLQVVTLTTLGGLSIEEAGIRIADKWKIGDAKRDDGIILIFAPAERKVRIEVGQGREGDLPDLVASRIIREIIVPRMRSGSPDQAVMDGVRAIIDRSEGKPMEAIEEGPSRGRLWIWLIFLIVWIFLLLSGRGHRRRGVRRRGGYWDSGWSAGSWGGGSSGGSWGGGSSGGGWSGGGGGFSGGGSSGSW